MSKITKALTALMVTLSMLVPMVVVPVYADDTHYTYNSETGVHTWDFKNFDTDAGTLLAGYDSTTFEGTSGTSYSYNGMNIISGGTSSKIESNGLKYNKSGVYITYTPTKNGTLRVSVYGGNAGGTVYVYPDKKQTSDDTLLYTTTDSDKKQTKDIEQTAELTAGITYYIWNSTSTTYNLQKLVFTEKENYIYDSESRTHSWNIKGLGGYLTNFPNETDNTYTYNNLTLTGATDTTLTKDGFTMNKSNSTNLAITFSKSGTLGVEVSKSNELYVDTDTSKDTDHKITLTDNKYSAHYEAGTYYIYDASSGGTVLTKLIFEEDVQANPQQEETPAVSINYETEKLANFVEGGSYTIAIDDGSAETVTLSGTTADITSDMFDKTLKIVKKGDGETTTDSEAQELEIPARPTAPTAGWTIDYDEEKITIPSSLYTSTAADSYTGTVVGSGEAVEFATGSTKYVYTPAVTTEGQEAFKSAVKTVTAPERVHAKPTGLSKTDETIAKNDGTITGLKVSGMEYRKQDDEDWTDIDSTTLTGLAPATYEIRYKHTDDKYASEAETITIDAYNKITVTFVDGDGQTIKTMYVEPNAEITTSDAPANPTKTATVDKTYTFNNTWEPALGEVTEETTYVAQFTESARTYTITWDIDGTETTEQVAYGETPSHAVPTKDADTENTYTFTGWAPEIAAVTGDQKYTAQFSNSPREYNITNATASDAHGSITVAEKAGYGTSVEITITPDTGYELDTLTVDGTNVTSSVSSGKYSFNMSAKNIDVAATFKAIDYTISMSVTNGTITVAGTAKYNETVNFTVEANPGYHITAVTYTDEDGTTQNATHGSGNSYSFTMPAKNTTITATITEDDKFAINIDSGITHGTVTATKTANIAANEQIEITITPATGYELGTFKVNNVETPVSGTTYALTVTADTTVTANFTPITYSITYNNTKDAAIDADKKSYNVETAVTLPTISKDGFTFDGWFDAETGGNKVTEITLGATGNKTYWAHWTEITTPEPADHGELTDWGTIPAATETENLAAATVAELEADSAWDIPASGTGVTKVTEGIQLDADTAVTYKKASEKPFYFTYKIKKGAGIAIQSLGAISMFSVSSGKVTLEGTDITLVDIDTLSADEHEFTTVVDTENDKVYTYENGELYGSVKALGNEDTVTGITFTAPESSEMVLESVSYGLMAEESTGAVHNWNFEEISKDTSVFKNDQGDAFNADAFKTKDTSYEYDGLKIVSGGNTSQIDTKGGLKTHKSTGAYIEYTPTKNGTLVVDIYATTADAQICVGTDKNAPTNAMTSHTVTSDEATGKATISLDSVNLVAGTKYYIWNSASKTCHIKNVTFTEFSSEETPNIGIDYETEKLTGFENGKSYTISYSDNENTVTKTIEAATAEIAVKADSDYDWFGKILSIVKKTDVATKNDSEPQTLAVPSISDAPSVVGVSPANESAKGRITGVDETMEYKKADDANYTAIDADDIKTEGSTKYIEVEVAEDTNYNVRVKKSNTNKTFEGVAATITVPAYVANSYTIVGAITTEDSVTSVKLVGDEEYTGVISGTTVTFTGVEAGTYTVNVTAAADYKSATSAPASITVSANDNSAFTITSVSYATPVITLSGGENGTFKVMNGSDEVVSDTAVKEGTELTVTATPNANYKLKTLTYQEDGESAVDISSTKTFTVGTKAITVTAEFEAEASEPEPESHYSYDLATKTHTWDFIGLDTELSNNGQKYNQTYFQADGEYIYEGLTIHGDSSSKFTSEGLQSSNKVQGYIKYTPSKNGTLTITAALDSGAELYVSAGSQDKGGETNANQLTPVSANTFTKDLTANTDYYIFNGSSKKMVVSALKFKESDEEPAPTSYTVSLVTNGGTIASGKNITSYTAGTAVTLPTATDITRDGYTFDGWYENSDFTGSKVETIATNATGNKTYYAKWNSNEPRPEPYIVDDSDENKTVYTWNINAFRDVLEGFNASDFANGAAYTHEELTLNGGTGAALSDDNGMLIKKLSGGGSVANTIAYTPAKNGTLTVTADTAAIKAEIYVSTKVDKSGATRIIYSETKKGIMTGTVDLTAGNTYYIFSGASVDASIKQVVYTADNNSDGPDVPVNPDKPRETFDATDEDKLAVSNASEGGTYEYSTDTRYPVDITSARSGVRTVASNLNVAKNSQHLAFEMTLNTLLKENTTASGAPDTFALEFTSGTGRVGGMLVAKTQTTVDGKDAMQLDWRTGSWQNRLTKPVVVGEKYTYDFVVNTTKDGDTETLDNIDLYIYDKDGKLYDYATGLNRRNATSIQIIYLMAQPRTVGENDSVTIENVRTFYYKPESTLLEIAEGKGKKTLSTETAYNLTADKFNDTEWEFKKPYSMLSDGSTASYMTTAIELKKTDGSALPQNITFDAANRKIKAASGLEAGDYELKATVVSSYNGKEVLREDYPITLTRPVVTPQDVMDDYSPTVEYNGKELAADTAVTDNITLPVSNSVVALKWNSYNSGVISNTGVVTRPLDDTEVTLEVEIASVEDPTKTKKETITVKVQGVRPMLEDAIAKAKAGITSVDDGRTMDADALTDLHEDIKFITKYKNSDYTGYEKVSYAWVSDSDYLKVVENETAEIWPAAVQKYNANLTLTAKYENQKLDEVIPVTINLTKDNAADKYAVRADSIAPANFSNVEGYIGTTISGDITLPTEGIFGSKISWTSSAPTYLSGTGKYKTPSNNTNVTLSAIISKGNVMSDSTKTFKMTLKGKSNESSSGGGGGGGGGGSSSSGKTSTFTTAGTSTAPVYIPPTNQNTDSQNGGAEPSGRFDDLGTVAWAEEAINTLADKGIISGRGDRIFAPNDDITRAEFATIIVNAFDLIDENAECDGLSDVTEDAWYYRYIASAYNNGIISGYDDGRFGVNDKITRQDMAVIIYRAMNSLGVEIEEVEDEIIFSDSDSISDYAKAAVTALQKADIVNGVGDDEFAPLATATRAQAAVIIFNTQR